MEKEIPILKGAARYIPISYDPKQQKLIFYDEIIENPNRIVMPGSLSFNDLKHLVIERFKAYPSGITSDLSGNQISNQEMIKHISSETETGKQTIKMEAKYLEEFLKCFK